MHALLPEADWADLLALWEARRAGRAMPERGDFVAEDFSRWFGELGMVDVVADGDGVRFRVRLAGLGVNRIDGRETKGAWLHDAVPPRSRALTLEPFEACVRARRPVLDEIAIHRHPVFRGARRLLLPLGDPADPSGPPAIVIAAIRTDPPAAETPRGADLHAAFASHRHVQSTRVIGADDPRIGGDRGGGDDGTRTRKAAAGGF